MPTYPTSNPTGYPSTCPTALPTVIPTTRPTFVPSRKPSGQPTYKTTGHPSSAPTSFPTNSFNFEGFMTESHSLALIALFSVIYIFYRGYNLERIRLSMLALQNTAVRERVTSHFYDDLNEDIVQENTGGNMV